MDHLLRRVGRKPNPHTYKSEIIARKTRKLFSLQFLGSLSRTKRSIERPSPFSQFSILISAFCTPSFRVETDYRSASNQTDPVMCQTSDSKGKCQEKTAQLKLSSRIQTLLQNVNRIARACRGLQSRLYPFRWSVRFFLDRSAKKE